MACPKCGCKTTYEYNDEDGPQDDRLERCAACGEVFDIEDHADEDECQEDGGRCGVGGYCTECHQPKTQNAGHERTAKA